ncbi:GTP cyclohydrolase FolE2 [Phaeobacter sp. 11ANDIMAR09]|uniref:GTP cyclohydrolase FolE2 n=1 Tax=Phaeobacter sp. 11ANDIMAR09 TaxID=1225647 RepID=UPI0006C84D24|nr:GTP cyclohydrolase FolE2 [Phaeobacter sp. 11ANDIMAR09]
MNEIVLPKQLNNAKASTVASSDEEQKAQNSSSCDTKSKVENDYSHAVNQNTIGLNRSYPENFVVDAAYKAAMPDLQNGPSSLIKGTKTEIQHVGISNFRLPLKWQTRAGEPLTLETSVTGSVSLEATKKGINMSRIMRSFYKYAEAPFNLETAEQILTSYLDDLKSFDARLQLSMRYPMLKRSLRSNLEGYQYYDVAYEVIRKGASSTKIVHFDYVYSSTCPCSLELSEHARNSRGQIATPHSQRSVARISVVVEDGKTIWVEDMVDLCLKAIPTETQVMVKREDEQAFAELNGSNPIFVEDAVRLIFAGLDRQRQIGDFRVIASHQESLHSHDAVSILTKGRTFEQVSYDHRLFASMYHVG